LEQPRQPRFGRSIRLSAGLAVLFLAAAQTQAQQYVTYPAGSFVQAPAVTASAPTQPVVWAPATACGRWQLVSPTTPYYQYVYPAQSQQFVYSTQATQPVSYLQAPQTGYQPVSYQATPAVETTADGRQVIPASYITPVSEPVEPAAPAAPAASYGDPYGFTSWLNGIRAAYGLGPVGYDPNLANWAAMNNQHQAARGLGHFVMGPARRQNSGMGGFPGVEAMWMASPAHRAALLDPTITWIGIAGLGAWWTFNAY
jgi:uncharacterized protein YkwD